MLRYSTAGNELIPDIRQYLLRIEHAGLHLVGKPEFFMSCAQIKIVNGGTGRPAMVTIPGHISMSGKLGNDNLNLYSFVQNQGSAWIFIGQYPHRTRYVSTRRSPPNRLTIVQGPRSKTIQRSSRYMQSGHRWEEETTLIFSPFITSIPKYPRSDFRHHAPAQALPPCTPYPSHFSLAVPNQWNAF